MTQLSPLNRSPWLCCLLLVVGGGLGVGALSCSGEDQANERAGAAVTQMEADDWRREMGSLMPLPSSSLSKWYGRSASSPSAPEVIGDLRPSLVCDLPGLFAYSVSEHLAPLRLTTAVRRMRPGEDKSIRAEVFWRQGELLQSLTAVEIAGEDETWHELQVDVPQGAGEILLSHRFVGAGLAEQHGDPIAWSQPVMAPQTKQDYPDVILLTIDTLRADAVVHAPYLESLMNSGKRWQQAYSPSNWTLPAYASLMTGLPPEEHGCGRGPFAAEATGEIENRNFRALGVAPTVAEAMLDAGYATCMLFQNPLLESWTGLERGFERYVRTADRAAANHDVALQWWQSNEHRARFLTLHYMAPHLPYAPPVGANVDLAANPLDLLNPETIFELDHSPAERRAFFDLPETDRALVREWYMADIRTMDRELEVLIRELRASSPDCVILIHADHGEELWDSGSFEHGHSFDDCVIHVPLAIVREGHIEAEIVSTPVAAHHLGTLMLEELGIPNMLPASALSGAKYADERIRSTLPLFRSESGGRELQADGSWLELPFEIEGSTGNPGVIDPETAARMAAMGYSGDHGD
jgi:arylsulfatase A-like enzyme